MIFLLLSGHFPFFAICSFQGIGHHNSGLKYFVWPFLYHFFKFSLDVLNEVAGIDAFAVFEVVSNAP